MADYYTRLLELRRAEGASQGLAKVPLDFYRQTSAYLADLKQTYEAELRENPSGRKGDVARQTHVRVLQIARYLVEARTRKILNAAFLATAGGARDLPNGLPEEKALFERVIEDLLRFRGSHAGYLEGIRPAPGSAAAPERSDGPSAPAPAPAAEPRPARTRSPPAAPAPRPAGTEVVFVRVLRGSPPLEFGGEKLELRPEDVLSVAPGLARILIEGGVAEKVLAQEPAAEPPSGSVRAASSSA
jgi:DNA replication initiation complex subunit (GINS family)